MIILIVDGEPSDRIVKVNAIYQDGTVANQQIDGIKQLSSEMSSLGIYGNKHTTSTLPSLISRSNQYNNYVKSLLSALSEEAEMQARISAQEAELKVKEKIEAMILQFSRAGGKLSFF